MLCTQYLCDTDHMWPGTSILLRNTPLLNMWRHCSDGTFYCTCGFDASSNLALVERFLAIISYFRPHLWLPKTLVGNCFQDVFPCNTSKCVLYRNWNWKLNFSLLQFWHAKCREITAIVQLCSPGICMHSRQSACLEMPSSFMFAIVSSTVSPSVSHSAYQLREYIMECGHIHIYQRLYASPLPLCSLVGFFCLFVFV